jgi:adenylate cyclase
MFADMVGYSWRMERNEELVSAQVARAVELVRQLIADFSGEIVQVVGDGILALFDSAEQSVRLALHVQHEFRDQAVWTDGEPIRFRIALNIGDVVVTPGNVQGHSVNVAARLQVLARPGSIIVTNAVCEAVRNVAGLLLRPLGRPPLKNISQSIDVFSVELALDPATAVVEEPRVAPPPAEVGQPSVAVLPLINLSGDLADDHLCKGIADDIIANLSRFRNLVVTARHSAFLFDVSAMSARDIAGRLGVMYLLAGNLRRSGKRLRISVELIEAHNDRVVWSDRFAIGIEDLLDLMGEITGSVASRLVVQIDMAERHQNTQGPRDLRAYGLILRGQQLVFRWDRESNAHARRLFQEATEITPDYARAYSSISRTHNHDWRYSWSPMPDDSLKTAVELARWAIQLDQMDARGYAELGYATLYRKLHSESIAAYERALALNPNDADVIVEYGDSLVYDGQPTRAIELIGRAMRLNPYYPDWYLWCLADASNALGRATEVIATVRQMHDPTEGRRLLAANYAHLGMMDEARAEAQEVLRVHPGFSVDGWRRRPPYRDQEILERYIEGLRKAGLPD